LPGHQRRHGSGDGGRPLGAPGFRGLRIQRP
jgi:hypothetical protein